MSEATDKFVVYLAEKPVRGKRHFISPAMWSATDVREWVCARTKLRWSRAYALGWRVRRGILAIPETDQ